MRLGLVMSATIFHRMSNTGNSIQTKGRFYPLVYMYGTRGAANIHSSTKISSGTAHATP